jgi:hypothetical protein
MDVDDNLFAAEEAKSAALGISKKIEKETWPPSIDII